VARWHDAAIEGTAGTELVAIADVDESRLDRFATRAGVSTHTDLDALLRAADVDWVHICTPLQTHHDLAMDCIDRGMKVDAGTIDWWMEKPVEVWQSVRENDVPLPAALRNLNTFIDQGLQESHRTWAKGSDFEFGLMLRPAYDLTEVDPFWDFPPRNFRCLRTLEVEDSVKPEIPHDPLSDAKAQAKDVINHYN